MAGLWIRRFGGEISRRAERLRALGSSEISNRNSVTRAGATAMLPCRSWISAVAPSGVSVPVRAVCKVSETSAMTLKSSKHLLRSAWIPFLLEVAALGPRQHPCHSDVQHL